MDLPVEFTMDIPWWRQPKIVIGDSYWGTETLVEQAPVIQRASCVG